MKYIFFAKYVRFVVELRTLSPGIFLTL